MLKAYWKSKWFNITLVLISSVHTLIAPKMIELKHAWFCTSGGMLAPVGNLWMLSHSLFAAAAIKIVWTLEDTNETVHKIAEEMKEDLKEMREDLKEMREDQKEMKKMLERILEIMEETHGESRVAEIIENVGAEDGDGAGAGCEPRVIAVPADDENQENCSSRAN